MQEWKGLSEMEFDPKTYNRINLAQIADAKETIHHILTDGFGTVATVVDIGCGTGNVTHLLADSISHERILALDVDPDMIKFARDNNPLHSVEFLVQDISVPFEKLDLKLREYEGKVDLVWSNRVLHWVPEKNRLQAAKNILRLLKAGGKAYINATYIQDFVSSLPPEQKKEVSEVLSIPSVHEQENSWRHNFRNAGANSVNVTFEEKSYDLEKPEDFQVGRHFIHYYRRYLPDTMTLEEKDKFLEPFKDDFLRSYTGPIGKPVAKEQMDGHTMHHYALFHIVVTK